jgi:cytochrome c oxidase assembly factor CtaG
MIRRGLAGIAVLAGLALLAPDIARADHPPVEPEQLASAWTISPLVLALTGLAILLFVQAMIRLRRRGRTDHAPLNRILMFAAGLGIIVLALVSPLDAIGEQYLLSGHMLQHVSISDAGPALLILAVRGPLLFFLLPAVILGPLARLRPLRRFLHGLTRPEIVVILWMAVIALWHIPALYEAAIGSGPLHNLEHALFITAGILVWIVLIDPARTGISRAARLATAVAIFAAGQILAEILLFSSSPLYQIYEQAPERLFGVSALTDQRYAGAIMMVEQALTIGLFVLIFFIVEDQLERRRQDEGRLTAGAGR